MSTMNQRRRDGAGPWGPSGPREVAADHSGWGRGGARRRCGAACGPAGGAPHRRGASSGSGTLSGKLQVVQVLDFHPDHNAFLKKAITEFATSKGWARPERPGRVPGGTDVYQKLQAQKSAGQPVDLIFHGLSGASTSSASPGTPPPGEPDGAEVRPGLLQRAGDAPDRRQVGGGALLRPHRGLLDPRGPLRRERLHRRRGALRALAGGPGSGAVSNPEANFHGWG